MRGLRKYLTPFAPDQSGAVSMCYALGGIVVIVDAGGCAGNICGFDEPRWQPDYAGADPGAEDGAHPRVGAVFSAGLRDMDAILGRDDLLVKKLCDASGQIEAKFIALIGTPVPAVIGTDLKSVAAMASRRTNLPSIAVPTDGMHLYDRGIEAALLELVKTFGKDAGDADPNCGAPFPAGSREAPGKRICAVLGLNPLDLFDPAWIRAIKDRLLSDGYEEVLLPGMEGGLSAIERCSLAGRNYVVSPSGLSCARYLEQRYQTPYEVTFPADPMMLLEEDARNAAIAAGRDAKILVVHQQVLANAIRSCLENAGAKGRILTATWFDLKKELARNEDIRLREEDDFTRLVQEEGFDVIIADPTLRPMAGAFGGKWIDAFHFAVSGQAAIDRSRRKQGKEEACQS